MVRICNLFDFVMMGMDQDLPHYYEGHFCTKLTAPTKVNISDESGFRSIRKVRIRIAGVQDGTAEEWVNGEI